IFVVSAEIFQLKHPLTNYYLQATTPQEASTGSLKTSNNQLWESKQKVNDWFTIQNVQTKEFLRANNAGVSLSEYDPKNQNEFLWKFMEHEGSTFVKHFYGKMLSSDDGRVWVDSVTLSGCGGNNNPKWTKIV